MTPQLLHTTSGVRGGAGVALAIELTVAAGALAGCALCTVFFGTAGAGAGAGAASVGADAGGAVAGAVTGAGSGIVAGGAGGELHAASMADALATYARNCNFDTEYVQPVHRDSLNCSGNGRAIYRIPARTQESAVPMSPVADAFAIICTMKRQSAPRSRYLSVDLAHIDLSRGGRRVLRDLRWRIRPGQRWVLLGANGAGKTQLLKLIAGDVWPQPRAITRRIYHWRGARSTEPMGVKQEIAYLGAERQDRYQHYDWNHRVAAIVGTGVERSEIPLRRLKRAERTRVTRALQRLGIAALARRRFLTLSQGERRLVLLARALAARPALLLLDEPLNGLDARSRTRFLAALAIMSRSALPWILATHRLEDVPAGVTHRAVLHCGRVRTGPWQRTAPLALRPPPARREPPTTPFAEQPLVFELHHASVWCAGMALLRQVSLRMRAGDCWVVHGANGSGKSTLLATLHGDHGVATPGRIWRRWHAPGMPLQDFQRRVGRVAPELQSALPRRMTALHCVVAGFRGALALDGAATVTEVRAATRALRQTGASALARRTIADLSYGQVRRILFARALVRRPDIVLLDEPYTGLDTATRSRLCALVDQLAARQRMVVIATHHQDDWPRRVTHELELGAGRVRYCGPVRRPEPGAVA